MKNKFKWSITLKGPLSNNDIDSIVVEIFHIHPTLSHPPLSPFTFARRRERGKPPPILTISGRKGFEEIFFGEWLDGK